MELIAAVYVLFGIVVGLSVTRNWILGGGISGDGEVHQSDYLIGPLVGFGVGLVWPLCLVGWLVSRRSE